MINLPINPYDFSWIRHGQQIRPPNTSELKLLQPFENQGSANNNKALLLIHGFASSPAVFRHFYSQLEHYQHILAPCLPGHGQSIYAFSQASSSQWLDFISHQFEHLAQQYEKVDVLGLSLGGLLACKLAQYYSINHLYLLAPALALTKSIPLLLNTAKIARILGFHSIYNRGGQVYKSEEAELTYRQLPLNAIIEILESIQHYQHQSWSHPTTLFLGKHDKVVDSFSVQKKLHTLPNLQTYYLEQSGHVLPIEADYQQILEIIRQNN